MQKKVWSTVAVSLMLGIISAWLLYCETSLAVDQKNKISQQHKLPLLSKGQHLGYIKGFNPVHPPMLQQVMDSAFQMSLKSGMQIARVQLDWTHLEPTKGTYLKDELVERLQFYHSKKLAICLMLCTADTDSLNYPKDLLTKQGDKLANNMKPDDPMIITRYKKMLDWAIPIAKKHGVYCISVGNEPDIYHDDDPSFMPHFINFVAAVRSHAHTIDSEIAITYTSTCDPAIHPDRKYGNDIAASVDVFCFNIYGVGSPDGIDFKATEDVLNKMVKLAKGKPILIQELGCSSIRNPDKKGWFHHSSLEIQRAYFAWVFKQIKSRKQIRAVYLFQLVENSPVIDKWNFKAFDSNKRSKKQTWELCEWLKGLGLINFQTTKTKPAWQEFLKGLKLIYHKES